MNWMGGKKERWEESQLLLSFASELSQSAGAAEKQEEDQGATEVEQHVHNLQSQDGRCLVPNRLELEQFIKMYIYHYDETTCAQKDNVARGLYDLWLVDEERFDPQKSCWNKKFHDKF